MDASGEEAHSIAPYNDPYKDHVEALQHDAVAAEQAFHDRKPDEHAVGIDHAVQSEDTHFRAETSECKFAKQDGNDHDQHAQADDRQ